MKKKRSFIRRVIAMLAALAMTVTYLPAYVSAEETEGLVLHYNFESLKSGTIVNDLSGNGKAGVVRPTGAGVETQTDLILGEEQTSFVMNGGQPDATHPYVELPQGVLNGLEDVTISCWVYLDVSDGEYHRIWDIGSGTTSYMYLLADGSNTGHRGYTAAITASSWSNEKGPEKQENLDTGRWIFTTVTFDGSEKSMSLYEDGELIGTEKTDVDLSVLEGSTQNYIGYGQWENDIMDGRIADFKIYNYAMTADEVKDQITLEDTEKVARDKATLTLGDISAVTEDLELPTKGSAGSDISWESSNKDVIAVDGTVTRPNADQADVTVTLTATIKAGNETETKTFEVTVKRQLNAKETAEADAAAIDLGNLSSVTGNLVLPTEGVNGSEISWVSSNEAVISSTGVVKQPDGAAVQVTLTATVTYEDETATRDFVATVVPGYKQISIKEVKPVSVTSYVGKIPNLPATVEVVYNDDTTGYEKVTWPTDLKVSDFAEAGEKTVKGTIVDSVEEVTATVTVTDEEEVGPEKAASSFDLSDISLDGTDTIYSQNAARAFEYLKVMDADRMLYNFRATFGQDTKGAQPLTGWDEPTGLLRGHSTGHFISALSLAYASTGDEEYKTKLDYMITEMRKLQEMSQGNAADFKTACTPSDAAQSKWSTDPTEWGKGFISAYSPDQFALLEQYTPYATIWAPYYTLHKLMAGFIDSYIYAGNEEGLQIAKDLGKWVYNRLSACSQEQLTRMWAMYIAGEYGGMNESLARLYEITGDEDYLKAAKLFDNTEFFNGLANNVDTIQGRHANQHIPQIVGAIHEYAATGDVKYYNIAQNFWEMVISRYAYSIGGVGTGERFQDPYEQGNNIDGNSSRGENCETCAAYNMLKLTMDLYNYNPDDASYMDYYERTLLNQIAASQSHDTTSRMHNGCTYMLPIDPGQRKSYDSDYGGFTCCNGTGMENHVKYQAAAFAHTDDTLYVNLYMPTTVTWDEKNITVKQETNFPSEHSKLTVTGSGEFTMKVRVPYWATDGFTVKVNGDVVAENPEVSSYVEINRTWSDGDVVTIDMPYTLHLDKTPDKVDESVVASLMYGPIVMVAKDQNSSYTAMNWLNVTLSDDLSESVEIVAGADEDSVPHLTTNGYDFYPMYDAYNYRYHAYVKVDEAGAVIDKSKLQALVDSVTGDNAPAREDYGPKSYRTLLEKIEAAQAELDAESTTQSKVNKALSELQDAIDGLTPAVTPNPDNLAASADITTSYCSSWENESAVNDGRTGSASLGNDCRHWGTWGNWDATEEWISYEWASPVIIESSEIYFFDNSNGGDGGVLVPSSYRYEYQTIDGEWEPIPTQDGLGTEQDQYNKTEFGAIETTGIRAILVKSGAGVGINEWKINGTLRETEEVILDFDFDDEDTGFKGGWAVAEPAGTLVDHEEGKALSLDGTKKEWLNVTKADGSSLLAGIEEMTVSFDMKGAANWAFFAAPNADAQVFKSEHYIGTLTNNKFTVERYNSTEQERPAFTGADIDANDWVHVEFALDKDSTTIKIGDGAAIMQAGLPAITDILGESPILQIGRANWIPWGTTELGEYYTGLLDNYKIVATVSKGEAADKAALLAAIRSVVEEDYTAESWAEYEPVLTEAQEVLADAYATQQEVDAAVAALTEAQSKLVAVVTSITVTPPTKVEYELGEAIDYTGMEVVATYSDGTTNDIAIEDCEVSGYDPNTAGEQTVTVEYDGKTATFKVTVKEAAKPEIPEVLADFNFDAAPAEGEAFDGGNAKASGTYTLVDHGTGKALKLDGTSQFLNVTAKDGTSLLTGVEEMTVSFQINPGQSATNWGFFAAANVNEQLYKSEKYLGIYDENGTVKAQRFNSNAQDRPASPEYAAGENKWSYITVVYAENETILYVNGVEAGREESIVSIPELLGDSSILYIGKSTWKSGEYMTGLIDNYKIVSHVMTADEIAAEALKYVEKDVLKAAIDATESVGNQDEYTEATWKVYAEALKTANDIYASNAATQAEVDAAAAALTKAQNELKVAEPEPVVTVVSITVTAPTKTEYTAGEELDLDGMKVTVKYSNGEEKEITEGYEVSGYDKAKTGEQTVTVTYEGKTATFKVTVKEEAKPVTLESITVTAPTKTEYTVGDELDLAGMKVVAKYSDDTEKEITEGYEVSGYDKAKTGEQTVTVTYEGKTATFKVTVKEAAVAPKLPYVDVVESDWFYDAAYYNYFAETMTGTDPTHFSPYEILPRAQFATILHRIEGKPAAEYTNRFPDVPDGQFYSTAVLWAADAKVVTGYTDSGYFGTNDPITREQMVVMMYRYADYKKYDISKTADLSSFSDAGQVSEFAETAMKWAVENGIIEGKENEDGSYRLDPQGGTSRAECSIIIQRFMETFDK